VKEGGLHRATARQAQLGSSGQEGKPRRSYERSQCLAKSGGSNSVVESQPSKLLVAGSIPVSRSIFGRGTSSRRTPSRRRLRGPDGPAPLRRGASDARPGE